MSAVPTPSAADPTDYTGAELGLPAAGPGSLASLLRRALAAVVDWFIAQLIAITVFDIDVMSGDAGAFAPLGLFLLMHLLLVGTIGSTIGHRVLGIEVRAQDAGAPRPAQVLIRTVLVGLFFPAVFTGSDGRGLHDKGAGTVTVRVR